MGDEIGYQPKDGEAMRFRVYEILEIILGDQAAFEQPADKSILCPNYTVAASFSSNKLPSGSRK